jgi:hypothetical protein
MHAWDLNKFVRDVLLLVSDGPSIQKTSRLCGVFTFQKSAGTSDTTALLLFQKSSSLHKNKLSITS